MPRLHDSAVPRPLLSLLFALLLANAGLSAWGNLRLYRTSGDPGFLPAGKGQVVTVGQVRPLGPASPLRVGDEVLAIDGQGLRARRTFGRSSSIGHPAPTASRFGAMGSRGPSC